MSHALHERQSSWGSIPIDGGVMVAQKAKLEAFHLNMTSPFRTAEKFGILDIIDPRETRSILCDWIEDAWERGCTVRSVSPTA